MAAPPNRLRATGYALASLLLAFIFAIIVTAGSSKWLPQGAAGVNHIVFPIVVFPFVWAAFAIWLYGARRRLRAWLCVGGLTAVHIGLIVHGFLTRVS